MTNRSCTYPDTIPACYSRSDLSEAYRMGWNHGHGIACHNVPEIGAAMHLEDMGRIIVDADNVREVHQSLCFTAECYSRDYSPFEHTAHAFNSAEDDEDTGEWDKSKEGLSEELWEAFDSGASDAIFADLATYTDEDYGIENDA